MEQEVMRPRIGTQEVLRAAEILRKYRQGKENLDKRITDNEQFAFLVDMMDAVHHISTAAALKKHHVTALKRLCDR